MQLVETAWHRQLTKQSESGIHRESKCCAIEEETRKDGTQMASQKTKKCAHIPCLCDVPNGEEYCGESGRDAGSEDVEIACQCDHLACPLTFRRFVVRSAADLVS